MPLSTSIYFSAFIAYCVWSHVDDFKKRKEPLWYAIAEAVSSTFLIVSALSYWLPSVPISSTLLLVMFSFGCAVTFGQMLISCRNSITDPELPPQGKWFIALSGSILGIIIHAPLLFWGFKSTVASGHDAPCAC